MLQVATRGTANCVVGWSFVSLGIEYCINILIFEAYQKIW